MLTYSNLKDHLDTEDLTRFLEIEQKVHIVSLYKSLSDTEWILHVF